MAAKGLRLNCWLMATAIGHHGRVDTAELTSRWAAAWADCPPIAHDMRTWFPDRWVRFHSLPGSRRYATSDDDYQEILRRHLTLLSELVNSGSGSVSDEVVIITASWSADRDPAGREPEVSQVMPARHWISVVTDDSYPPEPNVTHLWVSMASLTSDGLTRLLRLVADDVTAGVIITTPAVAWLYHPYDGGADVIGATSQQRDELRQRHRQWLSAHPRGL
jgi:hypothetical protein